MGKNFLFTSIQSGSVNYLASYLMSSSGKFWK